jgi:hypothetical protein
MKTLTLLCCFLFISGATLFAQEAGAKVEELPRDIRYYMMYPEDTRDLPAIAGRTYTSSDAKIVAVTGNSMKAQADGDCEIYAVDSNEKSLFARVTVGWQVQNPVLPYSWDLFIPDCEAHTFGDRLYVYGSVDASGVFCSPYLAPVTTKDLRRWESNGVAFSSFDEGNEKQYHGKMLWGSDIHRYNGKYLLCGAYEWFGEKIGNTPFMLESDSPTGKFGNFRWITGNKSGKMIDGFTFKVFVENDGTRYAVWAPTALPAEQNHLLVARMVYDNVIDEESIKNLGSLHDFYEGPSIRKRGDTYYLIYDENCGPITKDNHTPKRLSYATSKNIMGDYVYRGVILTIEDLPGNTNIQGSIEPFNGEWYLFYHRAPNEQWNRRALCVEKITFDSDGLILPVKPSSSGAGDGLDTQKPIYFNTSVVRKNCRFGNNVGKYGGATVKDKTAEIGFRYVRFTGKEKSVSFQGEGLENIEYVKICAGTEIIGNGKCDGGKVALHNVPKDKAELTVAITAKGEVRLETLNFKQVN